MKKIVVLGSTGSIGRQTLDVAAQHPDLLQIVGLAAHRQGDLLTAQAKQLGVQNVALMDEGAAQRWGVPGGLESLLELARLPEADLVVVAVAGVIGLDPTVTAIEAGKDIALASKEVLVAAGELVMPLIAKHGVRLTPIDSEHSAIFQCLQGYKTSQVKKIILTASGGPFRGKKREDLKQVTAKEALNHPTWAMGGKITIDSATLMNKGLEMIEAKWLFGLDMAQVDVCIHPQSVIHSMVEFRDGSVLGQLGWPNMRLPIQYALLYPERVENDLKPWNPVASSCLTFENVDESTFAALRLARAASEQGGTLPCIFNAANEESANAFLQDRVGFLRIVEIVEEVMALATPVPVSLPALKVADAWARSTARNLFENDVRKS